MNKDLKILDCTIRDGGYINSWHFEEKLVRAVYRATSKAGVDYVELGYAGCKDIKGNPQFGQWRNLSRKRLAKIIDGINGARVALMVDYGKSAMENLLPKISSLELIRVAVHKDKINQAVGFCERVKRAGYKVSINLMGYSNYTNQERKDYSRLLKNVDLDYIYVADSYGSILPVQIKELLEPLMELSAKRVGFHSHNNLQMAFANTLEAIRCGASIVDASIYGMGRGAGNLPLEVILSYLELINPDKYNVIPVLNLIDRHFVNLHKRLGWGYQLPYMLSGIFKCHPNYAKDLVERREYTIEDIWQVLETIKHMDPLGFSREALEGVLKKGIFGRSYKALTDNQAKGKNKEEMSDIEAPYTDRHKGKDFLVLANGPNLLKYREQIVRFIDQYDPIVLGANFLGGLFAPHYHAFNNKRRFVDYVEDVDQGSKLLIGQYIPQEMIREYTSRDYETLYYLDEVESNFAISRGIVQSNCRTISVLLLGVAISMGAKDIFVAGLDGYLSGGDNPNFHFYKETESNNQSDIVEKHQWNLKFLEQIDKYLNLKGKEGIHILTPTSYRRFYKGINNYI